MYPNHRNFFSTLNKSEQIVLIIISIVFLFSTILPAQNLPDNLKIGIAFSEKTWNEVHSGNYNYYLIKDWEIFFLDKKISYRVYTDEELDDYDFGDEDILILPGVEILSDEAIENIKDFMNTGKSIFVLGNVGTYKAETRKRFENVCNELTGITPIENFRTQKSGELITLRSNNPFINELENQSLFLSGNLNNYFTYLRNDLFTIGYYSNPDSAIKEIQPSVICGSKSNSRFAWMGFQISQISNGLSKNSIAEKLILNILGFLGNKPLVSLNNFPSSNDRGVVFINKLKTRKKFQDFVYGNNSISDISFDNFITPDGLEENRTDLNYLKTFGDIHLVYNNIEYLNESTNEIDKLFQKAENEIKVSADQNSIGILDESPFVSNFNSDSVEFQEFQFRMNDHFIKDNKSNRIIPFKEISNLFTDDGTLKRDKFESVLSNGQIFEIPVIDEFNSSFNLTNDEFQSLQINLVKENCWFTTLNELINWNELMSNISFYMNTYKDDKKIEIVVKNNNYSKVNNLGLNLILPKEYSSASTSDYGSNIYFDYSKHVYRLVIGNLEANSEKRFIISE